MALGLAVWSKNCAPPRRFRKLLSGVARSKPIPGMPTLAEMAPERKGRRLVWTMRSLSPGVDGAALAGAGALKAGAEDEEAGSKETRDAVLNSKDGALAALATVATVAWDVCAELAWCMAASARGARSASRIGDFM